MATFKDGFICIQENKICMSMFKNLIYKILAHPLTRNLDIDDPATTEIRRRIVLSKPFLKCLYLEWYDMIKERLQDIFGEYQSNSKFILEIGSGAGFVKQVLPDCITSDVFIVNGTDLVTDACHLPFQDGQLSAIVMTDVFHHIPNPESFLNEASRCLQSGGVIVMIEPWNTWWSKRIYQSLHSEPFEDCADWIIPKLGPLSGANGALPWIIFSRDKSIFEKKFKRLVIESISPLMPFSYLLSGGVSMRNFLPKFFYTPLRRLEKLFNPATWAMFAIIAVRKI